MRTSLLLVALVMAELVAAGCGTRVTAVQPPPTGSATATAAVTGDIAIPPTAFQTSPTTLVSPGRLTVTDNGAAVRLARGQLVTVVLVAQGIFSWHIPTATGSAVKQVNSGGGYPADQPAQATFLATGPGTATLSATNDTVCLHARPACLPPQQQWQVTLIVG